MKNVCWRKLFVVLSVTLCMGLGLTLAQGVEGAATSVSTSSLAPGAVK
ncbi:hypothetical protein [Candidatus Nitrotoga sp. AM1P]|nr:hypothetical protein [Candidatus Nitrotoga sp. AM1P]